MAVVVTNAKDGIDELLALTRGVDGVLATKDQANPAVIEARELLALTRTTLTRTRAAVSRIRQPATIRP
jgi:hypothetical protein